MPFQRPKASEDRREPAGGPSWRGVGASSNSGGPDPGELRRVDRKRRLAARAGRGRRWPGELLLQFTSSSFRMEDLAIGEREVRDALACVGERRVFRPPQALRLRNHVAILRRIERAVRRREDLRLPMVLRWYTSISCGLSMGMDAARVDRIEQYLGRMNTPQMRLEQALREVAALHVQLMADPIFPGFNGILSRLLLVYHMGRCGLPVIIFDDRQDMEWTGSEAKMARRLLELIGQSLG